MQTKSRTQTATAAAAALLAAFLGVAKAARAHCDTVQGPVVADARIALDRGDITPVLKWLQPENEPEVRAAFQETLAVRPLGREAQRLADRYFFETLVRLHRAGEGAPYTGLKDVAPEAIIQASDKALASASVDELVKAVSAAAADGIRGRFARALAARKFAERSVAQGREYVEAYVELTHYVERLYDDATSASHHPTLEAAAPEAEHR
ncbi:MAG: DUF6448 family protein [Thermoanaerobaculia bacterium]